MWYWIKIKCWRKQWWNAWVRVNKNDEVAVSMCGWVHHFPPSESWAPKSKNLRSHAAIINPMVGHPHSFCLHSPSPSLTYDVFSRAKTIPFNLVVLLLLLYILLKDQNQWEEIAKTRGHYYSFSCHDRNATYMISYL